MAELRTDDNSITNQSLAEFLNYAWLQNPVKVIANTNNFSQIRGFANSVETPRLTGCLPSLICFPIFAISSVSRDPECLICSWLVVLVWRVLCQPRKMGINQSCHWLGANPSPVCINTAGRAGWSPKVGTASPPVILGQHFLTEASNISTGSDQGSPRTQNLIRLRILV